jgi:hypothetical protein
LSLLTLHAASAGTLYGVEDSSDTLFFIDPVALEPVTIGPLGVDGAFGDLAYDEGSGTMYWVGGRDNNSLYTIDLNTGVATLVGEHGINDMFALGTVEGGVYGEAINWTIGHAVYSLNTTTAAPTLLGTNAVYPGGMDWDPDGERMILLGAGLGSIYSIIPDGSVTLLSTGPSIGDCDIAYDGDRGIFWAADTAGNLYQYDGSWARTTLLTGLGNVAALEYVPDAGPTIPAPGALLLAGTGLLSLLRCRRKLAA